MLMDMFYEACPIESKRRVHFHVFMEEVHEYIHHWRSIHKGDPLPSLAEKTKESSLLLCFDEFQITDIADAMLLPRLFKHLVNQGVIFAVTSNQHPNDLYKNGLQRELFLPFINLLNQSFKVIELNAKEDYRASYFKSIKITFYIKSEEEKYHFLQKHFNKLTNEGDIKSKVLHVKGRDVAFNKTHGDILFSTFNELCNRPLGPADYLAIAIQFNIILIEGIPCLSKEKKDQARRFVTLIDALYEQEVKIICTIAVPIEQLFVEDSTIDFSRTRSRLIEMQSERYF